VSVQNKRRAHDGPNVEVDRARPLRTARTGGRQGDYLSGKSRHEIKSLKNRFDRSSSARHITLEVADRATELLYHIGSPTNAER
jgi:hypothetical protein